MSVTAGDVHTAPASGRVDRSGRLLGRSSALRLLLPIVLGVGACALSVEVALSTGATGDYAAHGAVLGNNAGPALGALAHGHLLGFVDDQPTMGLFSLLLRAPAVAVARALGTGDVLAYRLGAAVCLLPLGLLAGWLILRRRPESFSRTSGVAAALLLLLSPAVGDAVSTGHPEDVLTAVLATVSVLAAMRGRALLAAVMLGSGIGTMPWAVIAAIPVLVATSRDRRMYVALRAGAFAAVLTLALPLADPAAFAHALRSEGHTHFVNPQSVWWPLSHPVHLIGGALASVRRLPLGLSRSSATLTTLLALGFVLALVWVRRRKLHPVYDPLALLVVFGLVRSIGDSTQLQYYKLASLIPLVVSETEGLGRPPVVAALLMAWTALMPTHGMDPTLVYAITMGRRLALFGYVTYYAFGGYSRVRHRRRPAAHSAGPGSNSDWIDARSEAPRLDVPELVQTARGSRTAAV